MLHSLHMPTSIETALVGYNDGCHGEGAGRSTAGTRFEPILGINNLLAGVDARRLDKGRFHLMKILRFACNVH